MITEDYVSFETAKLLKEKGFNEDCWNYYNDNAEFKCFKLVKCNYSNLPYNNAYIAPTLQMAMKWLRKEYNVFISPVFVDESEDSDRVEPYYGFVVESTITKKFLATSKSTHYDEPEDACEDAIKYCLENLI